VAEWIAAIKGTPEGQIAAMAHADFAVVVEFG